MQNGILKHRRRTLGDVCIIHEPSNTMLLPAMQLCHLGLQIRQTQLPDNLAFAPQCLARQRCKSTSTFRSTISNLDDTHRD